MKSIKLSIVALFIASASFAQLKDAKIETTKAIQVTPTEVKAPVAPKQSNIKWDQEMHDFGDIEKGKPVSYQFSFVNTSKETVLLTNVKASCGCTATNYTKTPIKPGEKGMVEATYNAAAPGAFNKTVTVTTSEANASPKVLTIKGKVETEENGQQKSVLLK